MTTVLTIDHGTSGTKAIVVESGARRGACRGGDSRRAGRRGHPRQPGRDGAGLGSRHRPAAVSDREHPGHEPGHHHPHAAPTTTGASGVKSTEDRTVHHGLQPPRGRIRRDRPNNATWSRSTARSEIASAPAASITARSTTTRPGSCRPHRSRSPTRASPQAPANPVASATSANSRAPAFVSRSGALVHLKRKGKSSVLSHLFLQAANSCELLRRSARARDELGRLVRAKGCSPTLVDDICRIHTQKLGGEAGSRLRVPRGPVRPHNPEPAPILAHKPGPRVPQGRRPRLLPICGSCLQPLRRRRLNNASRAGSRAACPGSGQERGATG
jgi:hypothetical protein